MSKPTPPLVTLLIDVANPSSLSEYPGGMVRLYLIIDTGFIVILNLIIDTGSIVSLNLIIDTKTTPFVLCSPTSTAQDIACNITILGLRVGMVEIEFSSSGPSTFMLPHSAWQRSTGWAGNNWRQATHRETWQIR